MQSSTFIGNTQNINIVNQIKPANCTKEFCIIHQNLQSIGTSFNKLEVLIAQENCDVVAVTEHWRSEGELEYYKLGGFNLVSSFCRDSGRHGGTAIYCRFNVEAKEKGNFKLLSVANVFECSAVQINFQNNKIIIVCIYRPNSPPHGDIDIFFEKLTYILEQSLLESMKVVIVGDFNINLLDNNKFAREFKLLLASFNIKITINEPTICFYDLS